MCDTPATASAPAHDSGFTLIELLVVILTLGVLATVVVVGFRPFRDNAQGAACRADLDVVISAANAFEVQIGHYPDSIAELVTLGYLKDYPDGTTETSNGDFRFVTDTPPTTVTRPC